MHNSPHAAEGKTTVSGKCVGHSSTSGHQCGGGEDHAHNREDEKADAAGFVVCSIEEDLEERSRAGGDNCIKVLQHKQQAAQEDEAREHANANAVEHDLGTFLLGVGNFLNHMSGRVEASKRKCTLEQTQHPGHTIRPADLVDEFAVDEMAALEVRCGTGENCDADENKSGHAPEKCGLVEERKKAGRKGVQEKSDEGEGEIDEKLMPRLELVGWMHKGNCVDNERRSEKWSSCAESHPSCNVDPSCDVADSSRKAWPTDNGSPVILTTGGRVSGQELSKSGSQAQVANSSDHQPPDDGTRASRGERESD